MSYSAGIFPWNHGDDMTLWWYTFPRAILYPTAVKVSKSMGQVIRQEKYRVTMNTDFTGVIDQCQKIPRKGQEGTWLYDKLKDTMHALIHLSKVLTSYDFKLIDCQQETDHIVSMGAETMGPGTFLEELRLNAFEDRLYLHRCLTDV